MIYSKSDAYQLGYDTRKRKQRKDNPFTVGTTSYYDYERGWTDHRCGARPGGKIPVDGVPAPIVPTTRPKTYVGLCLDRSGSMNSIKIPTINAFNAQVKKIREKTATHDIRFSLGLFGSGVQNSAIQNADQLADLTELNCAGMTPLFDAVGMMVNQLKNVPDANDKNTAFVVLVITDGYENSSRLYNAAAILSMISNLQLTDRWTFAFLVPPGGKDHLARQFRIPAGNVLEWEATERGVQEYSKATTASFDNYFLERSRGITSTKAFYTDLAGVKASTVKAKLRDISSEILTFNVGSEAKIRPFIEGFIKRPMLKGAAFYQLAKMEKNVQDYKQIIIRDKKTHSVYSGQEARNLLNLPHNGNVKIIPGNHGQYDIFVQSTSVNRKLPVGTQVIYWENAGQPFTTSY